MELMKRAKQHIVCTQICQEHYNWGTKLTTHVHANSGLCTGRDSGWTTNSTLSGHLATPAELSDRAYYG